jgi:hypothetical protein
MQPKGFFFNSSYRRASILKALFHGWRNQGEEREKEEPSAHVLDGPTFVPEQDETPFRDYRDQMKKAVG